MVNVIRRVEEMVYMMRAMKNQLDAIEEYWRREINLSLEEESDEEELTLYLFILLNCLNHLSICLIVYLLTLS